MWRILSPTSTRRPQLKVRYVNPPRRHGKLCPPRLVAIYLLIIILFYVYIRYHGCLNWSNKENHVTFIKDEKNTKSFRGVHLADLGFDKLSEANHEHALSKEIINLDDKLVQKTVQANFSHERKSAQMPRYETTVGAYQDSSKDDKKDYVTNNFNLKSENEFRTFRSQWMRYVQIDFDWRKKMQSCKSDMAWVSNRTAHQQTSILKSTFSPEIRPAREFSSIYIHTKTTHGQSKTAGGDAWRVYVRGQSSLVAKVIDHSNGSYEALFFVQEPGNYTVQIILDFSQCNGLRDPPSDWFIQGNAQGKYQQENLLGPLNDFLLQSVKPFLINVPEARFDFLKDIYGSKCKHSTCSSLWNPYGRWIDGLTWIPYLSDGPVYHWQTVGQSIAPSGTLWVYGDSVAKNLVLSARKRALCNQLYAKCEFSYNWIYPVLHGEQRAIVLNNDLDFEENRVLETIKQIFTQPDMMHNPNSTILLNLGLHFVMTLNFTTYQRLIDHVIDIFRSPGNQFKANVIWKTTTAIHKENAKQTNSTHFRFLTTQRIELFNAYSTWVMCRAGIPVVDVYPITLSYPNGPIDVVHYYGFVTYALEQRLEEYRMNLQRREHLTKICYV